MTVGVYKLGELKYVKYCSTIWCWYCQNFDELLMKTLCYSLYSIQYILKARWVLFHVGRQWWWAAKLLLQCFSCWPVLLGPKKLPPLLPEWKEAESINARRRNHNFMVQYGDPGWKGIKWYGHLEQKRTAPPSLKCLAGGKQGIRCSLANNCRTPEQHQKQCTILTSCRLTWE